MIALRSIPTCITAWTRGPTRGCSPIPSYADRRGPRRRHLRCKRRRRTQHVSAEELEKALDSTDPVIRMHAVEGMREAMGSAAKDSILKALEDKDPAVRFAAATSAGELGLAAARNTLLRMTNDSSTHAQMAAIFALHRLGDTRFSRRLEETLAKDPDPAVRANVCMLLGRLGEKTAARILQPHCAIWSRSCASRPPPRCGDWAMSAGWSCWWRSCKAPAVGIEWGRCWRWPPPKIPGLFRSFAP